MRQAGKQLITLTFFQKTMRTFRKKKWRTNVESTPWPEKWDQVDPKLISLGSTWCQVDCPWYQLSGQADMAEVVGVGVKNVEKIVFKFSLVDCRISCCDQLHLQRSCDGSQTRCRHRFQTSVEHSFLFASRDRFGVYSTRWHNSWLCPVITKKEIFRCPKSQQVQSVECSNVGIREGP
jgi:hypothetical protein